MPTTVRGPSRAFCRLCDQPVDPSAGISAPRRRRSARPFSSSSWCSARRSNHYTTLGLKQGASKSEIKTKFYELSKNYHPDRNPNNAYAVSRFKEVSEAYNVLSDPQQRRRHDSELQSARGGWGGAHYSRAGDHAAPDGFDYADVNTERRRAANYAWTAPGGGWSSARARAQAQARSSPFGFGDGYTRADFDKYARMAQRQAASQRERWDDMLRQKRAEAGEGAAKQSAKNAATIFALVAVAMLFGTKFSARAMEPEDDEEADRRV